MAAADLEAIARKMVEGGRGILAADESNSTANKRLGKLKIDPTVENRQAYREMLFTTPRLGEYISGTILYDETIRQSTKAGVPFVKILNDQNILPGIKVDAGTKELPGSPAEKITEGLDKLPERVAEYVKLGATFAKWRAVIEIGEGIPTDYCLRTNAHALARYARICQEGGLVPIVEPEVLMDGAHDIDACLGVTERTLFEQFRELQLQGVALEGMILKPNMVISGKKSAKQAGADEIAAKTVTVFRRTVPAAVPGIMFLSGGQSEAEATANLNAMNKNYPNLPWKLSFSYGRALQDGALKTWAGKSANVGAAQQRFIQRAQLNSDACAAKYRGEAA